MKRKLIITFLITMAVFMTGCSARQFESNMNCFAGKISGVLNVVANGVHNTVNKVRSCKRIKKSKESGGIASYTHKDLVFKTAINPAAVSPGDKLTSTVCYEVKTNNSGSNVVESRTLVTPNGELINITNDQLYRENGFWESNVNVQIPENAEPGHFTIIHKVSYNDVILKEKYRFTVINLEELQNHCKKGLQASS